MLLSSNLHLSLPTMEVFSVVALISGFLLTVSGSGGMVMLPALLLSGIPPYLALGTNKLYTTISLFSGAWHFIRKGLFKPRYWIATSIASFLGALFGVFLVQMTPIEHLQKALPIIIAGMALYFFFYKPSTASTSEKEQAADNSPQYWVVAVLLGTYSGFLGAGTAALWITLLVSLFRMPMIEAVAVASFMCFISNLTALIVFMALQEIDYWVGFDIALFGAIGAYIGARLAIVWGAFFIRMMMIVVTLAMSIDLALSSWFNQSFLHLLGHLIIKIF